MLKYVWNNFMKSFKVGQRQKVGDVMGQDRMAILIMSCQPNHSSAREDLPGGITPWTQIRRTL